MRRSASARRAARSASSLLVAARAVRPVSSSHAVEELVACEVAHQLDRVAALGAAAVEDVLRRVQREPGPCRRTTGTGRHIRRPNPRSEPSE